AGMLPCVGIRGATARNTARRPEPMRTTLIGRSRSVRCSPAAVAEPPNPFSPSRADPMMVGIVRASVINPDASTAPAPMYRMYALHNCAGDISEIRNGRPVAGLLAKLGWIGGNGPVM